MTTIPKALLSQLCEFTQDKPGQLRCRHCGKSVQTDVSAGSLRMACSRRRPSPPAAPESPFKLLSPADVPCRHRGEVTRQERCKLVTCQGGTLFDVYRCDHFDAECSVQNRAVKGLHVCKKCPARDGDLVQIAAPRRAPTDVIDKRTVSVAVIIPAHNYGQFLEECIASVWNQTVEPAELIVVDDASTDDTAEVCERLGVKRLAVDHRNVNLARLAGIKATTARLICCLDADDTLAPDYLAAAVAALDANPGAAIAFTDMMTFGEDSGRMIHPRDPATADINRENYIHAGAVVRRVALESVHGYEQPKLPLSLEDWELWRAIMATGWTAVKTPSLYHYRKHVGSMSWRIVQREATYFELAALERETITIAVPLSGRWEWWPRMSDWLTRQTWPVDQTRLILIDTSNNPDFGATVRNWLATCPFAATQYIALTVGETGLADADRRQEQNYRAVQRAMPRIYNRLRDEVTTPYVLVVEEDIKAPDDAANRLLRSFDANTASVSGAYRSRFQPTYVAWTKGLEPIATAGDGVQIVGGNGFGCVMLRASVFKQIVLHHGGRAGDFDPNFYEAVSKRWTVKLDWSVRCDHAGLPG